MPTTRAKSRASHRAGRRPDRLAAALAVGFIVLLLATELVLSASSPAGRPRDG